MYTYTVRTVQDMYSTGDVQYRKCTGELIYGVYGVYGVKGLPSYDIYIRFFLGECFFLFYRDNLTFNPVTP